MALNRPVVASGLVALAALGLSVYTAANDDGAAPATETTEAGATETQTETETESSTDDSTETAPAAAAPAGAGDSICERVDELLAAGYPSAGQQLITDWRSTTTTTTTTTVPPTTSTDATATTTTEAASTPTATTTTSTTVAPPSTGGDATLTTEAGATPPTPPTTTSAATTTTTTPCLDARQVEVDAVAAYSRQLCTQVETPGADLDGRFTLFTTLLAVDRVEALRCSACLLAEIKGEAKKQAERGNYDRSAKLWGYAGEIDRSIDTDRAPLPRPNDPESAAQYLRETWDRYRTTLIVLGIFAFGLFLGLNVIARVGQSWILQHRGHRQLAVGWRLLALAIFIVSFGFAVGFFIHGLHHDAQRLWLAALCFAISLVLATVWRAPALSVHVAPWATVSSPTAKDEPPQQEPPVSAPESTTEKKG